MEINKTDLNLGSVDRVAKDVDDTLRRYRERERELYAELVRVTARFDERVRVAMEELQKHIESLDALALEKGSEAQIRRKALGINQTSRSSLFKIALPPALSSSPVLLAFSFRLYFV